MVERRNGLRSLAGRRPGVLGSFEVAYALSGLYGRREAGLLHGPEVLLEIAAARATAVDG